jgi:hypothetical protein
MTSVFIFGSTEIDGKLLNSVTAIATRLTEFGFFCCCPQQRKENTTLSETCLMSF